jgi:hypothetical protein
MKTLACIKIAAVALSLFLTAAMPARGARAVSPDDTARFLAGMPPSADSPLLPLTNDPYWLRHARIFDAAFGQLEQGQLARIRTWAAANLAAPRPTMFYMFSGPDFLYADAFYTHATTYVLSALEPVGSVPDLARIPRGGVGYSLYSVERSLGSILSFSFFITKLMKTDLRDGQFSGTLPILYVLLARSGKTIRDVSLIALDDKGSVLPPTAAVGRNLIQGARITFAGSDGVAKTLYYFSTDLSNTGVRSSGFLEFCRTLSPGNSLIKSASYLMHARNFSTVRDFLLANSSTVVQDDSGIPLASFDPKKWRLFPFGRYAGPIAKFPRMYQAKYAELFRNSQPMDFGIGYRWRPYESNLLLAIKLP